MRQRLLRTIALLLLLLPGACGRGRPQHADREAAVAAAAQHTGDTLDRGFRGDTAAIHGPRAGAVPKTLRALTVTAHAGFDRVVFEFADDSVPGYHVEYATRPVVRCGSGDPVSLGRLAPLVVRFEPARAHDERGNTTVREREWSPGLLAVKEIKLVCDFEAQVEWVLGVAAVGPYRVSELAAPARLVLDIRQGR